MSDGNGTINTTLIYLVLAASPALSTVGATYGAGSGDEKIEKVARLIKQHSEEDQARHIRLEDRLRQIESDIDQRSRSGYTREEAQRDLSDILIRVKALEDDVRRIWWRVAGGDREEERKRR